jgi:hypothetical protein
MTDMFGSWEIQGSEVPEQYLDLANAYLDASIFLTTAMANSAFEPKYSRGKVVLLLAHHAVELFLKGAILKAEPDKKLLIHSLDSLGQLFHALYPDVKFETPFRTEYFSLTEEQIAEAKKQERPLDQLYRYPTGKDGLTWDIAHGFQASLFLSDLQKLQEEFSRLAGRLGFSLAR